MAQAAIYLPFTLPLVEEQHHKPTSFSGLSPLKTQPLITVGPAFASHARRILNDRTFEEDDQIEAEERLISGTATPGDTGVNNDDIGDEPEPLDLLSRDPKEWKDQDHYAVLGLSHLRYKATPDQIKRAHRKKVLKHHPDKKAAKASSSDDDSFFKCISKAHEILSDPTKRRQFDSVDKNVDDLLYTPDPDDVNASNFFEEWGPFYEREARFSKIENPPLLGDFNSSKEDVNGFYDFWYNFDSWRSFEYLDKDVPEGSESRDEKRHQEKKNRAQRAQKKKEDVARLRVMVDKTLAVDPRIRRIKQEEKAARDAKKKQKVGDDKVKKELEDSKKKEEEEQKKQEEQKKAANDKVNREAAKKAKEAAKKNLKREKKAVRALVTGANYFQPPGSSASASIVESQLSETDLLLDCLEPEEVVEMKKEMESKKEVEGGLPMKDVLISWVKKRGDKATGGKFSEFS